MRSLAEGRAAIETVGLPAVLKPVDSGGQRGVFRIDSPGDLESHLHAALAESPGQEAILEGFVDGTEMNGIVVARDGEARLVTLSDRLRPPGIGFGVGWIHVYPASIHSRPARARGAGRGARRSRRSAYGTGSPSRS